jgi:hypothetical protein
MCLYPFGDKECACGYFNDFSELCFMSNLNTTRVSVEENHHNSTIIVYA